MTMIYGRTFGLLYWNGIHAILSEDKHKNNDNLLFFCVPSVFLHLFASSTAPLGSAVALTASSFIPVCVQPLRACAEPPAGVSPPRRSPPCKYKYDAVGGVLSALLSVSLHFCVVRASAR